jgi:hypothetical protein
VVTLWRTRAFAEFAQFAPPAVFAPDATAGAGLEARAPPNPSFVLQPALGNALRAGVAASSGLPLTPRGSRGALRPVPGVATVRAFVPEPGGGCHTVGRA